MCPIPPQGTLAMSSDIFDCHDSPIMEVDVYSWHQWTKARVIANRLTMHKTAPYNRELSSPKYE